MARTLSRRSFLPALFGASSALFGASLAVPGLGVADGDVQLDLRQTLEKGLKARRPVEFQFIDRVIELVDADVLPKKTVQTTFLWARKKHKHPFQYFQRALTIRARLMGIQL